MLSRRVDRPGGVAIIPGVAGRDPDRDVDRHSGNRHRTAVWYLAENWNG